MLHYFSFIISQLILMKQNMRMKFAKTNALADDVESGRLTDDKRRGKWAALLLLSFQSIGVVYGDIGTSPLYVFSSVFSDGINHTDDILGVLSIIFYTLTLLPLVKYVFIVLHANDNGEGGTFALYSLLTKHAKVGLIPIEQTQDRAIEPKSTSSIKLKSTLENSKFAKYLLLFATMLGTSMLIGDGVLTPSISVLSAVGGLKLATPSMTEERVVWASVGILVFLFTIQRFGTEKVGYAFAPVLCIWFVLISAIGMYNFVHHDPSVVKALNPNYILDYFRRNKKQAWISLGGTILSVTGTEALFADVGHFGVRAIQISTCAVVYPSVVLAYTGQAAYLRKHSSDAANSFYKSIPEPLYWPMLVISVLSSIIASQSLISATFSVIQQSMSMGCFPRVKVVHTSTKHPGQVYIPEINYLLMLACIIVTLVFKNTVTIGNAYGIAVVFVMVLTSAFMVLVMLVVWKTRALLVIAYVAIIGSIESVYLSSVMYKFDQGGYLPLAFASILVFVMFVWNYVFTLKYDYELRHKISAERMTEIVGRRRTDSRPGLAVFYSSDLVNGIDTIPPVFERYVANVPALHSFLVFVSFESLQLVSKVPTEERFSVRRVGELNAFCCVVRCGYADVCNEEDSSFEVSLVEELKNCIREGYDSDEGLMDEDQYEEQVLEKFLENLDKEKDVEDLEDACKNGAVHFVAEHEVTAKDGSSVVKRILVDYAYNFIKVNLRRNKFDDVGRKKMLKLVSWDSNQGPQAPNSSAQPTELTTLDYRH